MRQKLAPIWLIVRYGLNRAAVVVGAVILILLGPIGFPELMLFAGCGLLSYGASFIYPPAAWLAPGAILAGLAIFLYVATFKPKG